MMPRTLLMIWVMRNYKHLLSILLILTLTTSCQLTKQERRLNRASKKLDKLVTKFPELKRTDTVYTIIPPQVIHGAERLIVDTSKVDSLRQLLATCSDTVIERVIDYIPSLCYITPIHFDNDSLNGRIWVEGGQLKYNIQVRPITVQTPCETIQPIKVILPSKLGNKWLWFFAGVAVMAIVAVIFRK